MTANATTGKTGFWSPDGAAFSSATDLWATPQHVFDALDAEFGFSLDVCATAANAKCSRFFTAAEDGLSQSWAADNAWMNPPYGRAIDAWLEKAADEAEAGATVVCLIPARTDTRWWHDQVMARASEVRLVRGRLTFGAASSPAPFPSAIVVYRPTPTACQVSAWIPPRLAVAAQKSMNEGPRSILSGVNGTPSGQAALRPHREQKTDALAVASDGEVPLITAEAKAASRSSRSEA